MNRKMIASVATAAMLIALSPPAFAEPDEPLTNTVPSDLLARAQSNARVDLSKAAVQVVEVPEGGTLRGVVDGEGIRLDAIEADVLFNHQLPFPVADCEMTLPGAWGWAIVNPTYPVPGTACQTGAYESHYIPISQFYFRTFGDYYGWADAYDFYSGSYIYIECYSGFALSEVYGNGFGFWYSTSWYCFVYTYGFTPNQFGWWGWDSLVGNQHLVGETYVAWA